MVALLSALELQKEIKEPPYLCILAGEAATINLSHDFR